jgi:hypothetical protein
MKPDKLILGAVAVGAFAAGWLAQRTRRRRAIEAPSVLQELASGTSIPAAHYRVGVIESDASTSTKDFFTYRAATRYADDVASESDYPTPVAYVFDDQGRAVYRGKHYAT